ncbi:MAG: hypothetical protein V4487_00220, partial [Chlamydiota bacterium]
NTSGAIFDYRRKYLPSEQTRYHCPPRFKEETIGEIQKEAERLFKAAGLRDFVRIDGWVSKEGVIRFSDLNPISGMEQNSFLFQQAAAIGFSHTEMIEYILAGALQRFGKSKLTRRFSGSEQKREPVYILMGGDTSERQVSLMSGTNVWLKLLQGSKYAPIPFLLTGEEIWELPYAFALHHTVEEVKEHCQKGQKWLNQILPWVQVIRKNLGLTPLSLPEHPQQMTLPTWIEKVKKTDAFVFLGLHGGQGEDGTLQKELETQGISFNGSGSIASQLCMDKHKTALCIEALQDPLILAMPQISFIASSLFNKSLKELNQFWTRAALHFGTDTLIVKPQCDGCSTGVVCLHNGLDLFRYIECLCKTLRQAPIGTFKDQSSPIEMPLSAAHPFLLEPFIQTDQIQIFETEISRKIVTGWCEMTIAVLETEGRYLALNPSMTVAAAQVLSVEEKFQGGTGINITPPPDSILSTETLAQVQRGSCLVAKALGIQGYARLDLFVECSSGKIRVIEANTLPALTPSTVFYHQALSLLPPLFPKDLLAKIIEGAKCPVVKFFPAILK